VRDRSYQYYYNGKKFRKFQTRIELGKKAKGYKINILEKVTTAARVLCL